MSSPNSAEYFQGSEQWSKQYRTHASRLRPAAPSQLEGSALKEPRRKRVLKACQRCKIKKAKCDSGAPCKRCKEDGMICVTGPKRSSEYKPLPRGYSEILENTHFTLVATIEKLYLMLREGVSWELEEPEMDERGVPIVHDVARILGCMRGVGGDTWPWAATGSATPAKLITKSSQQSLAGAGQVSLSLSHSLSLNCEKPGFDCEESESPFTSAEAAVAHPPLQQTHGSIWSKTPPLEYQRMQPKPAVFMQEIEDDLSDPLVLPMDSFHDQLSVPLDGMFDAGIGGSAEYFARAAASMQGLEWSMWLDGMTWTVDQDAQNG